MATESPLGAREILADGVAALADLGSEQAYELLQEVSRVAAGSDAAYTGRGRDPVMVEVVGVLLSAHMRASAARRVERRRVQLRSAVAEVVEAAVKDRDVDLVLSAAVRALRRVMQCQGASIRAFEAPGAPSGSQPYAASFPRQIDTLLDAAVVDIASDAAQVCWERQTALLMHLDEPDSEPLTTPADRDFAVDFMKRVGARELLLAPMGADGQCEGWIALTRAEVHEPFGPDDVEAVLAIGREVGNAVRHARAFQRQQELIAQLRELSDHKSWFTATLAHQLRTPLTSIRLHVEELTAERQEVDASGSEETAGGLAAIERSAILLESSVDSLLALASLEERTRMPEEEVIDLREVVAGCVAESQHPAQAVGVQLDTSGVGPSAYVAGDRSELEMVVDNIVGNAVKYTPDGGVVLITLAVEGNEVLFTCTDEGIGMSSRDLGLMFTPFHRSTDARKSNIPGSGLGMAIVQTAVKRHGGTIEVHSHPGRGTRVEVRLPSASSASGEEPVSA